MLQFDHQNAGAWKHKYQPAKGDQLRTNHLFNLCVAVALVVIIALTVREAVATAGVISQTDFANRASSECASLPSHYSLRTEYVKEVGMWPPYKEDGPTGVDGGLIYL